MDLGIAVDYFTSSLCRKAQTYKHEACINWASSRLTLFLVNTPLDAALWYVWDQDDSNVYFTEDTRVR